MEFRRTTLTGRKREPKFPVRKRTIAVVLGILFLLLALHSCVPSSAAPADHLFTVSRTASSSDVYEKLQTQDFMAGHWFFGMAMLLHGGYWRVQPGGYMINDAMSSWSIASTLTSPPALKWVVIPEGLRREQIADRLAKALSWTDAMRNQFLAADVTPPYELSEGFYFPDTYLIPEAESGAQVLKRFINRFNDNFAPYREPFRKENIKYDTAIKIASIIQREAGGKADMPVIAAVLWNRLLKKMPLQVDATLQYARGDTGSGYWAPITVADKEIVSPFNTYAHAGLPPSPISNPGLDAIDAVLHPTDTTCLYYLHDNSRQIHCSDTYEGHLANIEKYLRNQ